MAEVEGGAKDRILQAAVELMKEQGVNRVTMRAVAERAGVGLGSINYHFGSKDELLYGAVSAIIGDGVAGRYQPYAYAEVDPETRLRQYVRESGRVVDRFPDYFQVAAEYSLLEQDFELPQVILPLLREIFGNEKRELELRLMAYALMVSIQFALLRPEAFKRYSGLDVYEPDQRELALDSLVNNLLALNDQANDGHR